MRLDPCKGNFRLALRLYTGSNVAGLMPVSVSSAPSDAGVAECELGGRDGLAFLASAGTTYSVAVDGTDGDWGGFLLLLRPLPLLSAATLPPDTFIYKLHRGRGGRLAFRFGGGGGTSRLLCSLDRRAFRKCESPKRYSGLSPGWHRFQVAAVDASGSADPTPAARRFKVAGR
jgi:hypothetical protein